MASPRRTPQEYARLTLAVLAGGSHLDPNNPKVDWLGSRVNPSSGAARVNKLLLTGASLPRLEEERGEVGNHFDAVRRQFGTSRGAADDPITESGGIWRFDAARISRIAGIPLPPAPPAPSKPAEPDADIAGLISSAGAGFGTSDQNRRVELAAMDAVTRQYKARGWQVIDRSRDNLGYDLECRSGTSVERVEVKGISGSGQACIITAGEVEFARTDPTSVVCLVTNALTPNPPITAYPGADFVTRFTLSPIAFRAKL